MMSIKSEYFKKTREEFNMYIKSLRDSLNTIHLMNDKYFFYFSTEVSNLFIDLHKVRVGFDYIVQSLSNFSKGQVIQSYLIDEIEATNSIENIISTKHDIFTIINGGALSNDLGILSICNSYKNLLYTKGEMISTHEELRKLYDTVLKGSIENDSKPDGKFYRKNAVYITDGLSIVQRGVDIGTNCHKRQFVPVFFKKIAGVLLRDSLIFFIIFEEITILF